MPELLSLHADEESTYVVTATFLDEDKSPVAPNSAEWTLQDCSADGTVINSRKDIAISSPTSSEDIVVQGDDLQILGTETVAIAPTKVLRELSVEYVYNSSIGSDNPGSISVYFWVDRIGRHKVV